MRRRRARASHITGGAAATQTPTKSAADAATPKLHRKRFNRRLTRQTPQAFHSKEAVLHHVDDSTVATHLHRAREYHGTL